MWTYTTSTLPGGVTFTPLSSGGIGGKFDIQSNDCNDIGTYPITVTGTANGGQTNNFVYTIDMQAQTGTVTGTAITPNPYSYTVGNPTATLYVGEFTYSEACGNSGWTYTTSILPSGVTFTQISDGTYAGKFEIQTNDCTHASSTSITVTGTTSGGIAGTSSFTLNIVNPTASVTATSITPNPYNYNIGSTTATLTFLEFTYSPVCGAATWTYSTSTLPSYIVFT